MLAGGHLLSVSGGGRRGRLDPEVAMRWLETASPHDPLGERLVDVLGDPRPCSARRFAAYAPDSSSASVLAGALYLVRHAGGRTLGELRILAAQMGAARATGALACALVGLEQGVDALDVGELVAHEMTWVVDTLVRDHATVLWRGPGGSGAALVGRYPASAARTT